MEPAAAVADAFLELAEPMRDVPVELAHQLAVASRQLDSDASRLAWVLASLAHLIGLLTLELGATLWAPRSRPTRSGTGRCLPSRSMPVEHRVASLPGAQPHALCRCGSSSNASIVTSDALRSTVVSGRIEVFRAIL